MRSQPTCRRRASTRAAGRLLNPQGPSQPLPTAEDGDPACSGRRVGIRLLGRGPLRLSDSHRVLLLFALTLAVGAYIVCRMLAHEGYVVLEAPDGEAGLRLIQHHEGRLDLVLTDIDMPKIDGITVAEVLSALRPLLGVIGMSGGLNATIFQENLGLRPQSFLTKPFTSQALAQKIGQALARSQELLAEAEARQTVTRDYLAEARLAAVADPVAAAHRLRARALLLGPPPRIRPLSSFTAARRERVV